MGASATACICLVPLTLLPPPPLLLLPCPWPCTPGMVDMMGLMRSPCCGAPSDDENSEAMAALTRSDDVVVDSADEAASRTLRGHERVG
jgi:hypothetical protein